MNKEDYIIGDEVDNFLKSDTDDDENIYCETPSLSFINGKSICFRKHKDLLQQKLNNIIYMNDKTNANEGFISDINSFKYEYFHIPNYKAKRDCLYICAPNQAGKSTYVSKYLKYFTKIYSKENGNYKPIFLFSKLDTDPILDIFEPIRVDMNNFILKKNTLETLRNSIVIFDDVDQIHDKNISKKIYDTINEILCNGAHFDIHVIVTNHLCSDYRNTRIILNECSSITMFPKSGSSHQIEYTLKNYFGLSKCQIDKICSLRSRWVTIFKHYPQCVLYSHGVYLL